MKATGRKEKRKFDICKLHELAEKMLNAPSGVKWIRASEAIRKYVKKHDEGEGG